MPTSSTSGATTMPRARSPAKTASVKWSDAVGAATLPGTRAKTV